MSSKVSLLALVGNPCIADSNGTLSHPSMNRLYFYDLNKRSLEPITERESDISNLVSNSAEELYYVKHSAGTDSNELISMDVKRRSFARVAGLPRGTVSRLKFDPRTKQFLVFVQDKEDYGPQGVPHHSTAYLVSSGNTNKIATKVFDGEFDSQTAVIWLTSRQGVSAYDADKGRLIWKHSVPKGADMLVSECVMPNGDLIVLGYDEDSYPLLWRLNTVQASLTEISCDTEQSDGRLPSSWFKPPRMYYDLRERRLVIHWTTRMASYEATGSDQINLSAQKFQALSGGTYVCHYGQKVISFDRSWVGEPRGQVPHYRKLLVDQLLLETWRPNIVSQRLTPKAFEVRECLALR